MESLRSLRRNRALTFLDLATLTAIPARTIAEAEYGLRRLTLHEREQLALVLGLHPHDFSDRTQLLAAARRHGLDPQWLIAAVLTAALTANLLQTTPLRLASNSFGAIGAPAAQQVNRPAERPTEQPAHTGAAEAVQMLAPAGAMAAETQRRNLEQLANLETRAEPLAPALIHNPPPRPTPVAAPVVVAPFRLTENGPFGCPVQAPNGNVVLTQGYGVGSHAPAHIWGAVDLAVDANNDGYAEPGSSWYAPILATHDGQVEVTLDSYPGGNHIWVREPGGIWRTGYAHLAIVFVTGGQFVRAGEVIGLLGSSGVSSGPHLDYQVWRGEHNIDPTALVGCG
ncbi:MAG: peptidoglycan DD-metalloendopeptidase family protein [Oscillochloris sp.]|nr:peptidoglycan DD-metalloendopeptidase family protein [Oscillochloris sp.]